MVEQHHTYLDWYATLRVAYGSQAKQIYQAVAEVGAYTGLGDYLFAAAVFPESANFLPEYETHLAEQNVSIPDLAELRSLASKFVRDIADRLIKSLPANALLGLSSTYTQTLASLAIAQKVKHSRPDVTTVLGGSNMNDERADVLLARLPELDGICVGEGEQALVAALRCRDAGLPLRDAGIRTSGAGGRDKSATKTFIDLDANPLPDMYSYFTSLEALGLDSEIDPRLAFEIGRGCWWGEKHHCTFCGLNGESMKFRRKTKATVHNDILSLVQRHRVLDVLFADNILHPRDIDEVFARLPLDLDLRMHLEVKANLKRGEMKRLRDSGVWHMQPGIESLARVPLTLMRKGVQPWQNVRFLRDAEELGLTVSWNILTGFPGETAADYAEMIRQMPRLFHLQAPGGVGPLGLVRYSPLFTDPSLGVPAKRPTADNRYVYAGLTEAEIETMAEVFESVEVVAETAEITAEVRALCDEWRDRSPGSFLFETLVDGRFVEVTVRRESKQHLITLQEPWAVAIWEVLRSGKTANGLERALTELPDHLRVLAVELISELEDQHQVLYRDGDVLIALPTRYEDHMPYRLGHE